MENTERYLQVLSEGELFENSGHLTRFKEFLECFGNQPFFTKGLCKCMYLAAWDEEHFAILLEVLNDMALGKEPDTEDMRFQGEILAEEQEDGEYYVYQLSNAFLDNRQFYMNEANHIQPEFAYIINRALEAARRIDQV